MELTTEYRTTRNGARLVSKRYQRPGLMAWVVVGDIESFTLRVDELMTFYPREVREIAAALIELARYMEADALEDYIASAGPELTAAITDAEAAQRVRDILVNLRKTGGLSQAVVAERMEVSQPTVSQFESESGDVYLSTLQRYARAVGARLVIEILPTTPERGEMSEAPGYVIVPTEKCGICDNAGIRGVAGDVTIWTHLNGEVCSIANLTQERVDERTTR